MCNSQLAKRRMPRKGPPALAVDGDAAGFGGQNSDNAGVYLDLVRSTSTSSRSNWVLNMSCSLDK